MLGNEALELKETIFILKKVAIIREYVEAWSLMLHLRVPYATFGAWFYDGVFQRNIGKMKLFLLKNLKLDTFTSELQSNFN